MEAAAVLSEHGISAEVVSFHTVKPLDQTCLRRAAARFRAVATIEEHSLIGGLGSAAAEFYADHGIMPHKFLRFGTPDRFYKEAGEQEYAREVLQLSAHQIAARVGAALGHSSGD